MGTILFIEIVTPNLVPSKKMKLDKNVTLRLKSGRESKML